MSKEELIKQHEKQIHHSLTAIKALKGEKTNKNLEKSIIREVAQRHGVRDFEIISRDKLKTIVSARREVVTIFKDNYGYSFKRIGEILGDRTPNAIMAIYKQK